MAAVGQPPGHRRDRGAGDPGQAEEADQPLAVVERSFAEQEGQRGPQAREAAEVHHRDRHPLAQHRLFPDQGEDGAQGRAVARRGRRRRDERQRPPQQRRQREQEERREHVGPPPAGDLGDQAADGPRAQHPDQQAAHRDADHLSALPRSGHRGGERDHDLGNRREHAERDHRRGQDHESGAAAQAPEAMAASTRQAVIRPRRSSRSPSGTSSATPIRYPTWPSATSSPAVPSSTPKVRPITSSSGCT